MSEAIIFEYPYNIFLMQRLEFVVICQDELEAKIMRIMEYEMIRAKETWQTKVTEAIEAKRTPPKEPKEYWVRLSHNQIIAKLYKFDSIRVGAKHPLSISKSTVRKAINSLIEKGFLVMRSKPGDEFGAPIYTLHRANVQQAMKALPADPFTIFYLGGVSNYESGGEFQNLEVPPTEYESGELENSEVPSVNSESPQLQNSEVFKYREKEITEKDKKEDRGIAASADNAPAPALSSHSQDGYMNHPSEKGTSDATTVKTDMGSTHHADQGQVVFYPHALAGDISGEADDLETGYEKPMMPPGMLRLPCKPSQQTPAEVLSPPSLVGPPTDETVPSQATPFQLIVEGLSAAVEPPVTASPSSAPGGSGGSLRVVHETPKQPVQSHLPDPPPEIQMTRKQSEQQNERRAKEIWAIVERELETKYSRTQRKSENNTKGMENMLEDQVTDEMLVIALQELEPFYVKQFNLKKFHELMPGLVAAHNRQQNGHDKSADPVIIRPANTVNKLNGAAARMAARATKTMQ